MSLMLNIVLDTVFLPHVQTLLFTAFERFAPEIQMLKNNAVCGVEHGEFHNG